MRPICLLIIVFTCIHCSYTQNPNYRLVGGSCEGCEAVLEYGDEGLNSVDTLPLFEDNEPKIKVAGTVYLPDGKTPAEGVILYLYHTNAEGIYPTRGSEEGWGRRHGYIRGWVKTDATGNYEFYTFRPGTYPSRTEPAHIHLTILEPDGKYYWVQSYLFAGDPLLRDIKKAPRGGSGNVLQLAEGGQLLEGSRDITLGRNVQGYE